MESIVNTIFALMAATGIGCLVCNYFYFKKQTPPKVPDTMAPNTEEKVHAVSESPQTDDRPANLLNAPQGERDDLKRIKGVGPKLEEKLNTLGVYHFAQIAQWSEKELEWIDDYLSFKGRAKRDDWIAQAKALA